MLRDEIEIEPFQQIPKEETNVKVDKIEVFHVNDLSYKDFFSNFMRRNVPVIISGVSDQWECMNWTNQNSSECPINFEYLTQKISAELKVPIANCNKTYFNSHEKSEIPFHTFLTYWKEKIHQNNDQNDLLYLKDWHLQRELPNYKFYETPKYFASDWLNEYCNENNCDDYRFVYMGPKKTW